ncbi:hypothetical protein WDH52_02990 [Streptomyces sp. TRM70308]|uniref:hypothetical protein n=1 Tax=Streptomyces sp. TRM70308 TaxID=3131932 RepID=UPI003CFDAFD2
MTFGAWEVRYLPAGECVEAGEDVGNYVEADARVLADHPRVRRCLVRILRHRPFGLYCFHWSDGTDLETLDEMVREGCADRGDFSRALVGEALGMACLECRSPLRVVRYDAPVSAMLLGEYLPRSVELHSFRPTCPVCGVPWHANVLEYVDPPGVVGL